MRGFAKVVFIVFLLALPILFSGVSSALTVNPQEYNIQQIEYGKSHQIIATLINSESSTYSIQMTIDRDSAYLGDYASFEQSEFSLMPNEKKNIKFSLNIPQGRLSPEDHTLQVNFMSSGVKVGEFRIRFSVPGEKKEELMLNDVYLSDTHRDKPLYIVLNLKNKGNVIARATPVIEVYDGERFIERFGEESRLMVMPGSDYNISLMYDLSALENKAYRLKSSFIYNNNLNTNIVEKEFTVLPKSGGSADADTKTIRPGDRLTFTLLLENPTGQLSFFRTGYSIAGTGINNTVEGEITGTRKELALDIDTSTLEEGTYLLNVETRTGKNLETLETEEIQIVVKPRDNKAYIIGFLFFIIALIVFYALRPYIAPVLRRGGHAGSKGDEALQKGISAAGQKIRNINSDFDALEGSFKGLADDVSGFINESNNWLDERYGRGTYGFK
jgi:hypothetical protein